MAKITTDYIVGEFYRRFHNTPPERQRGIIEGLLTIHRAQSGKAPRQDDLPFPEPQSQPEVDQPAEEVEQ